MRYYGMKKNVEFTPEELLETVLNVAASAVEQQFDDDTREALWVVLDACATAYGIEVHREFEDTAPPTTFPFKITDATPPDVEDPST
jgi:hypothetical protein